MVRTILKSKIHRARVTEANVDYAGSLTLDAELLRAAGLVPYEQVHVLDVNNGARVITYCIEGPAGSGTVCVNGAAARRIALDDVIIVVAYAQVAERDLEGFQPRIVLVDEQNRIQHVATESCRLQEPEDISRALGL